MICPSCRTQVPDAHNAVCPSCMAPLQGQAFDPEAGIENAAKSATLAQSAAPAGNADKTVEEFNVGVWVFAGLSLLTLIITLTRGIVPIELLEAALWAVLAWVWHKKGLASHSSKEVLVLFAILLAGGEGYLF